jgi:GxxExxY protein
VTHSVIGGLYEVHNVLGPGFIYRLYVNALYYELKSRGLTVIPHHVYEIIYRQRKVGAIKFEHLQIDDRLMIFPVAIQDMNEVSINNLKAWLRVQGIRLGIVANFYPVSLEFMVLRV